MESMEREQQNEMDPTKHQREALAAELVNLADEKSRPKLEKFKNGLFFIPSETLNTVRGLIDLVPDEERRNKLLKLYIEILDQA